MRLKVIIAGSRTITDYDLVKPVLEAWQHRLESKWHVISEIVSGTARGVDKLGEMYAQENDIEVVRFPADWAHHGKGAGPIRNEQMAEYADVLFLIWDGESRGSANMKKMAQEYGLEIFEAIVGTI